MASKDDSLIDAVHEAYWTIRSQVCTFPESPTLPFGVSARAVMSVQVDPNLMKANQVTLDAVTEAPRTRWTSASAVHEFIRDWSRRVYRSRRWPTPERPTCAAIVAPADLARAVCKPLTAHWFLPHRPDRPRERGPPALVGDAVVGEGPGLLFVIEKLPGANTLQTISGVRDAFKRPAARPAKHHL